MNDEKFQQLVLEQFQLLNNRFDSMDKRLGAVEENVASMNQRLGAVEDNVASMNQRLGAVEDNVASMSERVDRIEQNLAFLVKSQVRTEKKLDDLASMVARRFLEGDAHFEDLLEQLRERLETRFDSLDSKQAEMNFVLKDLSYRYIKHESEIQALKLAR
ncbi:hypothetical protein F9B85_13110 [Heliorestis acidaminivorans]|uniref:t-SNARE coiled-coil homology domain-containing protein n=1 Tax=Heliorestis acidaminivorans TaxID=553427 RepID=A0A6I0ENI9_9FIRM|nr:hypothetical protein [Heliorestis acidaminivorans]KAB2951302.1 hypothetical protein F9B85_13110 [Heliorestis acidaminivorans]